MSGDRSVIVQTKTARSRRESSSLLCTSTTAPQRCAMAEEFELNALTPLDGRHASRVAPVRAYFSEAALIKYRVRVEVEYLVALSGAVPALKDVFAGGNLAKWRGVAAQFGSADAARCNFRSLAGTAIVSTGGGGSLSSRGLATAVLVGLEGDCRLPASEGERSKVGYGEGVGSRAVPRGAGPFGHTRSS